jgi:hypothetical protein
MVIFTENDANRVKKNSGDWRIDILNSILLAGTAESDINVSTAKRSQVLDFNASVPRIKRSIIDKFKLILEKPNFALSEQIIRCTLCNKAINFNQAPIWHHLIKYNINCFAAFICFDPASPSKPSCKCYRKQP